MKIDSMAEYEYSLRIRQELRDHIAQDRLRLAADGLSEQDIAYTLGPLQGFLLGVERDIAEWERFKMRALFLRWDGLAQRLVDNPTDMERDSPPDPTGVPKPGRKGAKP